MKRIVALLSCCAVLGAWLAPGAAAAEKLRLGYLRSDLHHLAAWVALEKGYFRDEGLDVEVAGIFNAGAEEMGAFAANSLDVGYLGMAPSVTGVANKAASVKAEALANAEGSAIVVRAGSPARSLKDLEGKTIAIPGFASVQDFLLHRALESAKMAPGAVKIIVIKPPEMIGALETGQIDAFIAWEPHATKAVTKGVGRVLLRSADIWPNHPCCVVAFQGDVARQRPAVVQAFLRAHARATAFILANPAQAVAVGVKYSGMDETTVRAALGNIIYRTELERAPILEYASYLARLGYIKETDPDALLREYLDPAGSLKGQRP
ncbi:MAG TPA: ABC transporter substrate-binding protein [bacterium]